MIKKFFGAIIFFAAVLFTQSVLAAPHLTYRVHVQDYGWLNPVSDGAVAGTIGKG